MRIVKNFRKFQEGGEMPPQEGAPEEVQGGAPEGAPEGAPQGPQGGGNPMEQILQVAAQAVQSQDCQAAMAVCQALLQLAGAGSGAPAQQAPPAGEEPTFARRGSKLIRLHR